MENKTGSLLNSYELGKLLGQGTFAKVYHGRSIETGQSVAIKVIDKEKVLRVGLTEQVKREISVMRRVRHPNIVHLYEVLATKTKIYFVMEYAKGGELFNKVAKGKLKEDVAHKYFKQLINAVDFCHSNGVYHRDLKPENLLLDENENLKVSDFGLSALAESRRQDGLLHTACGTPAYVAPEVISKKGYDGAKADIWSCGVILFVLLANYLPFHDSNLMELYRKIGKAEFKFPKGFPQDARKLVIKMLEPNPETRVSMEKIRESGWFRKEFSSTNAEGNPGPSGSTETEPKQESIKPTELNAFDIISFSFGFDLTGFFEESDEKKEARFTSLQPASVIISRLMEMAKSLGFKIKQIEKGLLKFETEKEGKRGAVSIDVEIFEFTPALYMVEMRKSDGGTIEYQKMMEEDIRPALQDIVWAWQGTRSYYLSFVTDGEWVDDGVCWSYKGNIITNALVVSLDVNYSTLRKKLAEKIGLNEERFQIMLKYISPVRPNLPPLEVNDDDDLEAFKFLNLQSKTAVWHIELCVSLKERGVKKSTEMDETLRRKSSEMDITRSQCPPPLTQCEEMPIQNGGKSGGFVRNFVDCDVYETKPTIMHDISSVKHDINFASCDNKVESGEKSIQLEIIDLLSDSDTERGSSKEMRSRAGRKKDHAIIDVGEDFEEDVGSDENCGSDACEDSEGDIGFEKENVEVVAPLAMTFVTALILQRPMLLLDLCSRVLRMKYFGNFLWMVKLG